VRPRRSGGIAILAVAAVAVLVAAAQSGARTAAKCNSSNQILVGVVYSMSGPGAGFGKVGQQGVSMAIRDVNAEGGVLGRCLKEDLADDAGSPTTAAQVARKLIDQDRVSVIMGPFLSSPASVVAPLTTAAKMIEMVESAAPQTGDASQFPYAFRTEANSDQQAQIMVPFAKARGWKRIAILSPNNAFGVTFAPAITQIGGPAGIEVVKNILVNSGTPDVTPQMQDLKSSNPDALMWAINADPDQIAAIKARNALGWNVPVVAVSSIYNTSTTNNFSKQQLTNIYGYAYKTLTYAAGSPKPTDPLAKTFISRFARWIHAHNIKETISQAAGGYDSVVLWAQAANAVKSLDADKVKQYFETHQMRGVRGRYVWTSSRHDGVTIDDFNFALPGTLNNYGIVQRYGK